MERLIELMESRIRRNVYVRFGGEHLKTYHSNMERRWVLSLHFHFYTYDIANPKSRFRQISLTDRWHSII